MDVTPMNSHWRKNKPLRFQKPLDESIVSYTKIEKSPKLMVNDLTNAVRFTMGSVKTRNEIKTRDLGI
ncbi:MAG: hypothetical protein A2070_11160 [Bdellovibrionales bacterium GWC1_52_8]|nr:MAG: hypothetical protein A2Z97_10915 [Bdellovibrionales bacterium GWB1_52_6]OFZ03530.1 MAG: hypothetical protein A2X97_06175 [Bdellovibrionales bacterium GWA1_52_35]OFZ38702.1 MAG: hypothetical protein A2070_11160 [Bdellovibrionales bacterium GWC1_52_8]